MRIEPKVVQPTSLEPRETSAKPTKSEAPASVVALSSAAAATRSDDVQPPEIGARLERIRVALERGDYPIDLVKLAARIVDDEVVRSGQKS
jgi:anti-sigma28 factor (negative regulator of flagellin synthesis)